MTCYNLGLGSIKHAKLLGDEVAKRMLRALKVLKVLKALSTRSS